MIIDILPLFYRLDGVLYWKKSMKPAGSVYKDGYLRVNVNGKRYLNHRILYFMHHWALPARLDHVDGNRLNNAIGNLRPYNASENRNIKC
jgi:hypothetical protein